MVIKNEEVINKKAKLDRVKKQAKLSSNQGLLSTYFYWKDNKYYYDTYKEKLMKFDKNGRNYKYSKSLETNFKYTPLYNPQSLLPYHTTPFIKLERAKFNLTGDEMPNSLKEFYNTLKTYWRRTFGDYVKLSNGKIQLNKKQKGKMNYVNLSFKETYAENDTGTRIWRAIRVSNWKDFEKQ